MTPLRQAFHAALVSAGLLVALPTFAEPLAPIGPPTAAEVAAAAPVVAPAPVVAAAPVIAPAASAKAPSWLANRPAPKAPLASRPSAPSTGRILGLLLVLGSLGGAALYLKRRGRGDLKRTALPRKLSVVSSTRIGPKAHAVVISVNGRQMLLGVTDSSVKRLAFIDEVEEDEREREPARRVSPHATRAAAIAVRTIEPEAAKAGSFSDLLKTAFSKKQPPPREADAASILAQETQDTAFGKPVAGNPAGVRLVDVEGQAQGLIRRLSGPRA